MPRFDTQSPVAPSSPADRDLLELLSTLTIEQKVRLVVGRDFWSTLPIPEIGLRSMLLSDGPSGVRGPKWDEREPSLSLPSATALSSTWSRRLAREYGAVLGAEALDKTVDVVLGPTINIQRSPLGGRHFEAFSEDPFLTGVIGSEVVRGLQESGVGAAPKHFVANDSETDRFSVNAVIDDQALHEVYLAPFEAVVEAGTWTLMSGYNSVNGTTMTESPLLLDPLVTEWGFDGVVMSDWNAVRSLESAAAGQHLAMPGPRGPWSEQLVAAVQDGRIEESVLDEKVLRLLRLATRVGALDGYARNSAPHSIEELERVELSHDVAVAGAVLLKNDKSTLPLEAAALRSVALLGDSAAVTRTQGGGSATVLPKRVITPLEGLRTALGADRVVYAQGAVVHEGLAALPLSTMTNPDSGLPGALVRFLDADGATIRREDRLASDLQYLGAAGGGPSPDVTTLVFSTLYTPERTGELPLGIAAIGDATLTVDGRTRLEVRLGPATGDVGGFMNPASAIVSLPVLGGIGILIEARVEIVHQPLFEGAVAFRLGTATPPQIESALIREAEEAARLSDVSIVVVGTNERVESEGFDRSNLELPGSQNALVAAVAAASERTIVIVNSGSPVVMPWYDDVDAVLVGWFGGQEMGRALTAILLGEREPGGRLTATWPTLESDVPVLKTTPDVALDLPYSEGIHVGYRAWARAGRVPRAPFGHGLGYTEFQLEDIRTEHTGSHDSVEVRVRLRNVGRSRGEEVVQVYLTRPESSVARPEFWLAQFDRIACEVGEDVEVVLPIPGRAFEHWRDQWQFEIGTFEVLVGLSSADIRLRAQVLLNE